MGNDFTLRAFRFFAHLIVTAAMAGCFGGVPAEAQQKQEAPADAAGGLAGEPDEVCPEGEEPDAGAESSENAAPAAPKIVSPLGGVWDPDAAKEKGAVGRGFSRYRNNAEYEAVTPQAPAQSARRPVRGSKNTSSAAQRTGTTTTTIRRRG